MLPSKIAVVTQQIFNPSTDEVNCQVVTLHNTPHVRTMRLYDITDEGCLIFLSYTQTQKWRDIQVNSAIAVCFFSVDFGQLIAEGAAALASNQHSSELTKTYWSKMPAEWKKNYLRDYSINDDIPASFGVIRIEPKRWELLALNRKNYMMSERKEYILENDMWHENNLQPL